MFFLGPVIGAIIVYLFLRMQVWSKPDAQAAASHGLWVGIIGWMASSLQGAMNSGILRSSPTGSFAPASPDQIASALAWPLVASLAVHALGQLSYPAPKAPRRYAELTVRRIRDFLPRKLAWTTAAIFAYAALAVTWIAAMPAYTPVPPAPPAPLTDPQQPDTQRGPSPFMGQDGRIPGAELALWLGGSLMVLALGTWLVLLLIARRRQLETLDGDDNRTLRMIATNRLLRTVSTIAAGLATIAGNFAAQPAPGVQSSWFNVLALFNMVILLAMWWWRVPELPSLLNASKASTVRALRKDPLTHGAARLSISVGTALGLLGGIAVVGCLVGMYAFSQPLNSWALSLILGLVSGLLLAAIAGGDLLMGRNYGTVDAPIHWPRRPVSRGLLSFAMGSAVILAIAVAFAIAAERQPFTPRTWPFALAASLVVAAAGAAAILAARRRRGVPEPGGTEGMDAALRAISMYRIVRTLAAYCLGQAAALLLITGNDWYTVFPSGNSPLGPSPAIMAGMVLAAVAVIVVVVPVRSLLGSIPRAESVSVGERTQ